MGAVDQAFVNLDRKDDPNGVICAMRHSLMSASVQSNQYPMLYDEPLVLGDVIEYSIRF
jgi:hypothetical protein